MVSSTYHLWSVRSSEEHCLESSRPHGKPALAYPVTKPMDPPSAHDELNRSSPSRLTPAQHAELRKQNRKVNHDESSAFVASLRSCAKKKDLYRGSMLHMHIQNRGLLDECADALITMYAKCGALAKAKELLELHESRDVFSWTALIAGYARQEQSLDALNCFQQMQDVGLSPDAVTYACALKACGNLKDIGKGEGIHNRIASQGLLQTDVVLGTALVDMYAKCGDLEKAQTVLEGLPVRNNVSWSALITGYAQQDQGEKAWLCFEQMKHEGISADPVTYLCVLKACASSRAVEKGEQVHHEIARRGLLKTNVKLGNALVDMYAKCGSFAKAQRVLEGLPHRNVVSWNSLIVAYAQQGHGEQALDIFQKMQQVGLSPDAVTFSCVLKACGSLKAVNKGEEFHDQIAKQGLLEKDVVLVNALVDMYAKCGDLAKARQVLKELRSQSVVAWNSLIAAYIEEDQGEKALNCFDEMQFEGISPNAVTFACILKACSIEKAINKGEQIHDEISRQGLVTKNVMLGSALVDMYAKCGALVKAQQVLEDLPFRDIVSFNALIAVYTQQNLSEQALTCFERMHQEGISPNHATFCCILKACSSIGALDKGEQLCDEIVRQGLFTDNIVLGTAVVDMYAKCGALIKARQVFEGLPSRDIVSWSTLIAGYAQQSQGEEALNCFEQMKCEGLSPDAVTFSLVLKACAAIGASDKGEKIHKEIARQGLLDNNIVLGTALVDMYAKCGALAKAQSVLEELSVRDVVSWSALITGYAQQGQGDNVVICFERMHGEGLSPDAVMFTSVLNAYTHQGLVDVGYTCFLNMKTKYRIEPSLEHYICMIDLFGRAGHLDKAVQLIHEMPLSNCSAVWCALLGACQKWGEVKIGRWAFEQAVQEAKCDGVPYVLMANLYNSAGMQRDAEDIEALREQNKAWKEPRFSGWIDMSGKFHTFYVSGR